MIAETELSNL